MADLEKWPRKNSVIDSHEASNNNSKVEIEEFNTHEDEAEGSPKPKPDYWKSCLFTFCFSILLILGKVYRDSLLSELTLAWADIQTSIHDKTKSQDEMKQMLTKFITMSDSAFAKLFITIRMYGCFCFFFFNAGRLCYKTCPSLNIATWNFYQRVGYTVIACISIFCSWVVLSSVFYDWNIHTTSGLAKELLKELRKKI